MASTVCVESLVCSAKRLKISTPKTSSSRALHQRSILSSSIASTRRNQIVRHASQVPANESNARANELRNVRLPKAVQAVFLAPLRRAPTHGIPVCDLQIRSYSVRNLEAFTDFCMRAAYYLNLPAKGPVPLPRITERWTVPRSNFVHKKSQENFERITMRRLIQIQDGHADTVAIWLAYIQQHRYYGVGMKANVFEHSAVDVLPMMDAKADKAAKRALGISARFRNGSEDIAAGQAKLTTDLLDDPFKAQWGAWAGMAGLSNTASGRRRFARRKLASAQQDQTKVRTAVSAFESAAPEETSNASS